MKYDEFIKHVQSFAQSDSREQAEQATRGTLEVLADRIVGDEANQLAAQLPDQIGNCLRGREGQNGSHFSLKEFYQRVSERTGIEPIAAVTWVRAVFAVLNSAITPGEFADVRVNLSDDYQELFASPEGLEVHR
jgi:uncharacterized protein (DUF2267 family)